MCFSAEGSFTLGTALVGAGGYCVWRAASASPRHLPLAAVPAVFGVQQLSEGVVWLGLGGSAGTALPAALVFLFFALALWPVWMPLCAACAERRPALRRLWWGFAAMGLVWGLFLYLPIVLEPERRLSVQVVHHSVRYDYGSVPLVETAGPLTLRGLYLVACGLPLVACSDRDVRRFGLLLGASAAVTQAVFWYAFSSVWCFFAAAVSLYLCRAFPRAGRRPRSDGEAAGATW